MTRLTRAGILAVLGTAAFVLSPASARAGFLPGFSGNTQMADHPTSTGIANFSVYENTSGGSWVTALTLSGTATPLVPLAGINTNAKYVYFFQIVNNGTASLSTFKVLSGSSPYSSAGYLATTVFTDSAGAVGPSANRFLGTEGTKPDDVLDGSPSERGVTPVGFATAGAEGLAGKAPIAANLGGASAGGFAAFLWGFDPTAIPVGGWSVVVFLTSDVAPMYGKGTLLDGGDLSDGDIPVQSPEPGTLVLSVLGVLGLAGSYGWRRWRG